MYRLAFVLTALLCSTHLWGGQCGANAALASANAIDRERGFRVVQSPTPAPVTPVPNAASYLSSGFEKEINGNYQGAMEDYNQAIRLEPQNVSGYRSRANLRSEHLRDSAGAIADYDRVIQLEPNNSMTYLSRLLVKLEASADPTSALADLEYLLRKHPQNPQLYLMRGAINDKRLNNPQQALADYDQSILLTRKVNKPSDLPADLFAPNEIPEFSYLLVHISRASLKAEKLNNPQGALADLNKALELSPNNAGIYATRGWLKFFRLKDERGARADYDRAIQIDPNSGAAYAGRALLRYQSSRDIKGSLADYRSAIKADVGNAGYYYNRGDMLYSLGRKREALKDFQQVVKLNKKDELQALAEGIIALEQRNWSGAIAKLNQALKTRPDLADGYKYRGLAQRGMGDRSAALADWNKALNLYQSSKALQDAAMVQSWIEKPSVNR